MFKILVVVISRARLTMVNVFLVDSWDQGWANVLEDLYVYHLVQARLWV
jgi:hypothetical protein